MRKNKLRYTSFIVAALTLSNAALGMTLAGAQNFLAALVAHLGNLEVLPATKGDEEGPVATAQRRLSAEIKAALGEENQKLFVAVQGAAREQWEQGEGNPTTLDSDLFDDARTEFTKLERAKVIAMATAARTVPMLQQFNPSVPTEWRRYTDIYGLLARSQSRLYANIVALGPEKKPASNFSSLLH